MNPPHLEIWINTSLGGSNNSFYLSVHDEVETGSSAILR